MNLAPIGAPCKIFGPVDGERELRIRFTTNGCAGFGKGCEREGEGEMRDGLEKGSSRKGGRLECAPWVGLPAS